MSAVHSSSLDLTSLTEDEFDADLKCVAVAPHGRIKDLYYRVSFPGNVTVYLTPKQAGQLSCALDAVDEGLPQ